MALKNELGLWEDPRITLPRSLASRDRADVNLLLLQCLNRIVDAVSQGPNAHLQVLAEIRTIVYFRRDLVTRSIVAKSIRSEHLDALVEMLRGLLQPQDITGVLYESLAGVVSLINASIGANTAMSVSDVELFSLLRGVLLMSLLVPHRFRLRESAIFTVLMLVHKDHKCRQELFEILLPSSILPASHATSKLSKLVMDIVSVSNWGCAQCLREVNQACGLRMVKSGRLTFTHNLKRAEFSAAARDHKAELDQQHFAQWRASRHIRPALPSRAESPAEGPAKRPLLDTAVGQANSLSSLHSEGGNFPLAMIPPVDRNQPLLPGEAPRRSMPSARPVSQRSRSTPTSSSTQGARLTLDVAVQTTEAPASKLPEPELYSRAAWQEASRAAAPMQFLQPPPFPADGLDPEEAYQLGRNLLRQSVYLHNISSLLLLACDRKESEKVQLDVVAGGLPLLTCQALHAGLQAGAELMEKVVDSMKQAQQEQDS